MAGTRAAIDRDAVLRAGVELGAERGLDAVSLRGVASRLGVTPMALYRYVESKDDLVDGMLELLYAEIELPERDRDGDWFDALLVLARSARRVLLAHPWALPLLTTRSALGPNELRLSEEMLAILRHAGFEIEEAVRLHSQITRIVLALISLEADVQPRISNEERRRRLRQLRFELESLPADTYPHLIEAAPFLSAPTDPERAFEEGMELLRAGLLART